MALINLRPALTAWLLMAGGNLTAAAPPGPVTGTSFGLEAGSPLRNGDSRQQFSGTALHLSAGWQSGEQAWGFSTLAATTGNTTGHFRRHLGTGPWWRLQITTDLTFHCSLLWFRQSRSLPDGHIYSRQRGWSPGAGLEKAWFAGERASVILTGRTRIDFPEDQGPESAVPFLNRSLSLGLRILL